MPRWMWAVEVAVELSEDELQMLGRQYRRAKAVVVVFVVFVVACHLRKHE